MDPKQELYSATKEILGKWGYKSPITSRSPSTQLLAINCASSGLQASVLHATAESLIPRKDSNPHFKILYLCSFYWNALLK